MRGRGLAPSVRAAAAAATAAAPQPRFASTSRPRTSCTPPISAPRSSSRSGARARSERCVHGPACAVPRHLLFGVPSRPDRDPPRSGTGAAAGARARAGAPGPGRLLVPPRRLQSLARRPGNIRHLVGIAVAPCRWLVSQGGRPTLCVHPRHAERGADAWHRPAGRARDAQPPAEQRRGRERRRRRGLVVPALGGAARQGRPRRGAARLGARMPNPLGGQRWAATEPLWNGRARTWRCPRRTRWTRATPPARATPAPPPGRWPSYRGAATAARSPTRGWSSCSARRSAGRGGSGASGRSAGMPRW
jgi:hypothetical protein